MQKQQTANSALVKISKPGYGPAVGSALSALSDIAVLLCLDVKEHFRTRATSWIMSFNIFGMGLILIVNPTFLNGDVRAHSYVYLLTIMPQWAWAIWCVGVGLMRIVALVINGTFPRLPWMAHVRLAGAFLSCFLWFNLMLGVWVRGGWTFAVPMFTSMIAFELLSTYVAANEAG